MDCMTLKMEALLLLETTRRNISDNESSVVVSFYSIKAEFFFREADEGYDNCHCACPGGESTLGASEYDA